MPATQPPSQPRRVEAIRSNASGKRPMAAPAGSGDGAKRHAGTGGSGGGGGGGSGGSSGAPPGGGADSGGGGCSARDESEGSGGAGPQQIGMAVELEAYSAEAIDAYFLAAAGGPFLEGLSGPHVDGAMFARLVATARDARRVTEATHDAQALSRAQHWVSCLEEQGEVLGWSFEDVGDEAEEDEKHAVGGSGAGGSGVGGSGAVGSGAGGSSAAAHAGGSSSSSCRSGVWVPQTLEEEPEVIADDGNFDNCSVCGQGGLLICCDVCPQAYHAACLGASAPPEDEDDEAVWYCPPCKEAFAAM